MHAAATSLASHWPLAALSGPPVGVPTVRVRLPSRAQKCIDLCRNGFSILLARGAALPPLQLRALVYHRFGLPAESQVRTTWPGRVMYQDEVLREEGNAAFKKTAASGNYRKGEEAGHR